MTLPTPAQIKKLADACRKAGIKHFKSGDLEFTLGDAPPKSPRNKTSSPVDETPPDANFKHDELSYEQLLNWSITSTDMQEPGAVNEG